MDYTQAIHHIFTQLQEKKMLLEKSGATSTAIARFETANGIALPNAYRQWLQSCDGGDLYPPGGVQLYGVAHKPFIDPSDPDRPDDRYVVIGAMAWGDPLLYQKGSEEIAIYNHGAGRIEPDETFSDFYAFLQALPQTLGISG